MKAIVIIVQVFLIVLIAPFLSGLIKRIKNNIRMRRGAPLLQPYYNLLKLFMKGEVISENTSWIFKTAPFIVLGSVSSALLLVPIFHTGVSLNYMGDFLTVIFMLALGRFFLALAGLDAASAFGGMGSSREMFISSLVEPIALLSVFTVSLNCGSTSLEIISSSQGMRLSSLIAAVSLFVVTVAETTRVPVDSQETHLELTMVHEAMALEYSGRSLALIELAAYIKQIIFFSLLANIVFPFSVSCLSDYTQFVVASGIYMAKIIGVAVLVAILEVSVAKMRLFRVVDFLAFSFALSIMAIVVHTMGS